MGAEFAKLSWDTNTGFSSTFPFTLSSFHFLRIQIITLSKQFTAMCIHAYISLFFFSSSAIYLLFARKGKVSSNILFMSISFIFEEICTFVLNCPFSDFLSWAISIVFGINTVPSLSTTSKGFNTTTLFPVRAPGSFFARFSATNSFSLHLKVSWTKLLSITGGLAMIPVQKNRDISICSLQLQTLGNPPFPLTVPNPH